jgi:hypothetical protein
MNHAVPSNHLGEDIMTTSELPVRLAAPISAEAMLNFRRERLQELLASEVTPCQQEAFQHARIDFAAAAARAFRERVRALNAVRAAA